MIGTEDDAVRAGKAEMFAGMARCVEGCHPCHVIPVMQENVGREGWICTEMEPNCGCPCVGLEG